MATMLSHLSPLLPSKLPSPASPTNSSILFSLPSSRFRCSAGGTGFFTKLGRLIKEKAKSDVDKLFSGFSKTRENLAVIDELLLYWNLSETDRVLDELEEALLVSDFGPKITIKIVESLRDDIYAGKLKSGSEIKDALKKSVLDLLTSKGLKTELQLGFRKPAVIMIVGVNGGGKTTSLGKLANRLKKEGAKILMAAGDTFRAAASDQLEIWAERTGCEIVVAEKEKAKGFSPFFAPLPSPANSPADNHYRHRMSDTNNVDAKGLDLVDNASKVQEEDNPPVEDPKHSDLNEENPMPSPQQEEAAIKKKYGGLLPKKNPLISKDHERAFFDSADWALGKQGTQKSKGPLEALRPKLQPTPHQQARARRSAYAPADEGEVDGENAIPSSEDQNCAVDGSSNEGSHSEDRNCPN